MNEIKTTEPVTLSELMYYLCFTFLFGYRAFGGVDGYEIYKYTLVAAALCFMLHVALTRYTWAELFAAGSLMLVTVVIYGYTGEKGLAIFFMMMLGLKGIPVRRVFSFAVVVLGTGMALLTFLSGFGYIYDRLFFAEAGTRHAWAFYRHSLGYPHTNTLLTTYIVLMMLVMYLTGNKSKKLVLKRSAIMFLGAVFFWLYCDSRTGILMTVLYLALNYYFCFHAKFKILDKIVLWGLYPLINFVVIGGATVFYPAEAPDGGPLYSFWDRFRLANFYLHEYPIRAFGVRIVIPEAEEYGIDVSQIHLLLNMGVVAFIIMALLYALVIYDCVKNERRGEAAIILSIMVMGISDPFLYNLSCKNLTFLFMGAALYALSDRVRDRLPGFLKQEFQLLKVGDRQLPQVQRVVAFVGRTVREIFPPVKEWRVTCISLAFGGAAVLFHVLMNSGDLDYLMTDSVRLVEFLLRTMTTGVYSFLIAFVAVSVIQWQQEKKIEMLPVGLFMGTAGLGLVLTLGFWIISGQGIVFLDWLVLGPSDQWELADFFRHIGYGADLTTTYWVSDDACFPPLTYLFFHLLYRMNPALPPEVAGTDWRKLADAPYEIMFYVIFVMLFAMVFSLVVGKILGLSMGHAVLLTGGLICTFPVFSSIERGNPVLVSMLLCLAALYLIDKEDPRLRELAILFVALSISIKIYPAFLAVLWLKRKRFKEFGRLVLYSAVLFFVPFVFMGGMDGFMQYLTLLFRGHYDAGFMRELSSIRGAAYVVGNRLGMTETVRITMGQILENLFLMLSVIGVFLTKDRWREVFYLSSLLCFYMPTSWVYNTIYLVLPLIFFLLDVRKRVRGVDLLYAVMFGLIFTIPIWYYIQGENAGTWVCIVAYLLWLAIFLNELGVAKPVQLTQNAQSPQKNPA